MAEPFDVMDVGRMAVIVDPAGAALCLWEPKRHIGASLVNTPGALTWNDLLTPDAGEVGARSTATCSAGRPRRSRPPAATA